MSRYLKGNKMNELILGFICGATLCGLIFLLFLVDRIPKEQVRYYLLEVDEIKIVEKNKQENK